MASRLVHYQLANTAGYKFDIVKMGRHEYDKLAYYYKEDFPDAQITRPGVYTSLEQLHTHSLLTVNGYVHQSHYFDEKLYLEKCTKSMIRSRQNHVGILNFGTEGPELKRYPIEESHVTLDTHIAPWEKVYVSAPETLKSPVLVVAGYLVFENPEFFYRVSDTTYVLRLDRLQFIERLYELERHRDIFAELGVPVSSHNDTMVLKAQVQSAETVKKLLTLHNSFWVETGASSLSVTRKYLDKSNVPGNFRCDDEPRLPLVVGYGKLAEYQRLKKNDAKWTVLTQDMHYNNYLFSAQSPYLRQAHNAHRVPGQTYRLTPAFMLEIALED